MIVVQIAGLFLLLIFSGLFASSEIVFIVANKAKLQVRARRKKFGASLALSFVEKPEAYLTTVLVGNNIANIAFSSLAAILLQAAFDWSNTEITIVVAFVILLFGELIPKSLLRIVADAVVSYASFFLRTCSVIFSPLIWITQRSSRSIVSLVGFEESNVERFLRKKDVEVLLEESEKFGAVGKEERKKIVKVITLSDVLAKDIMKARTDIVAVDVKTPVKQAWHVLVERGYSKLLVFDKSIDNIIGIVFARDFFSRPRTLSQILRDTVFVPETKNCSDLLRDFRIGKVSLAVVVDEFGGTAGVVTSEDILEEFLGEISDEPGDADKAVKRLPDGSFLVNGRTDLQAVHSATSVTIPDGPYDTIAGFIIHTLGRIPAEKEDCLVGPLHIHIVRATRTRVELVKIFVEPQGH
ncbi:MAG TPA: hemolysin family protein [Bacteroidota bacterium]|nr:hemolysin family protein [Bacteroidota bacterium]